MDFYLPKDFKNKNIPTPINILRKLTKYLEAKRKRQIVVVFILSIFASLGESISIAVLIPFIGFFINPDLYLFNSIFETLFNFFNITNEREILGLISFLFILIVLLSGYLKLKFIKISNITAESITSDFKIKIFNFLINQNYSYYFKHGSNEIMSNLSQKTGAFMTMTFAALNILNSILVSTAIIIVLIINEPFYTPIIITMICLFFFIIFKIKTNIVLKKGQKVNLNQNLLIEIFDNAVRYLPEIIIYNLKYFFSTILTKSAEETAKSSAEIRTISMSPRIYLEVFVIVLIVIFIFFSGLSEKSNEINLAYFAILAFGAQKCLPLVNNIYLCSVNFKASTPPVLTFLNILEQGIKEKTDNKYYDSLTFNKSIKLEKLSFQYNQNLPKILSNINLEIKKGDKIALKGETGSGKSTFTNIISGLLDPTEGKILIDGTEVNLKNKKNWQKNIAIVPQNIFLHDKSLLENIAIAVNLSEIDIERVKKCANLAKIDTFIQKLPNNYYEEVGEKGVRLSGGQKQRIGIARALYRKSNLIIMDEPTNALDKETENLVMESIISNTKDITIIMISHSNSTLKFFDKIIDLEQLK